MFKKLREKFSKFVKKVTGSEKKRERKKTLKKQEEKEKVSVRKKAKPQKKKLSLIERLTTKEITEKDLEPLLEELEYDLIEADCSYDVAQMIIEEIKNNLVGQRLKRRQIEKRIKESIENAIKKILENVEKIDLVKLIKNKREKPFKIIFLGFNGTGKTTTMAKIANLLKKHGIKVVFAAGDTFRAASIEQLEEHARNLNIPIIKHNYGADPAAVIFDAIKYAEKHGIDVVLADTAGRVHTDENLMKELEKIVRVNKPDLKILVLDSLTGSDVINQFEYFDKAAKVDAVVFTKLDVNEKGGNILSVIYQFKKPVLFFGTGQGYEDLIEYDPDTILKNLIGE
ncbi:MAG: signal recognition particle-docking protein FtsY [Candidatus Aenigmarchaeota archaeon]|nr:signal recognition particle-docking protein FtsY [Candidatus Aenigmarchaeota archaeon]